MALKKFKLPVTCGVHAPELDEPEVRDPVTGQLLQPYRKGLKHVPPGTEVEVEEEQAQRIFATFGTYEEYARRSAVEAAVPTSQPQRKVIR